MINKKILVSAYACEPDKGSEPGVGWNWVKAISKHHQVWVITKGNNRASIERELKINPDVNLHFIYVDLPEWMTFWKKGQRGVRTYYYLWQFAALFTALKLNKKEQFALGHHVTFVNDWLWTFFALMPMPFVWGPIGSHPRLPSQLLGNKKEMIYDFARIAFQSFMRLIDPLYLLSVKRAARIITINKETANLIQFRKFAIRKVLIEPAIAVELMNIHTEMHSPKPEFHLLFVGRFVAMKGPHLAIDAFGEVAKKHPSVHLTIVGKGPLELSLKKQAASLGITEKVSFIDWLSREDVLAVMQHSDAFLFPSMEGGGMVVLEAMACGCPVICLDFGGPGSMVNDETGFRIKPGTYRETSEKLALAIKLLIDNKELRHKMGEAALFRVRTEFNWCSKADLVGKMYNEIL